jgi:hypothetical protein
MGHALFFSWCSLKIKFNSDKTIISIFSDIMHYGGRSNFKPKLLLFIQANISLCIYEFCKRLRDLVLTLCKRNNFQGRRNAQESKL